MATARKALSASVRRAGVDHSAMLPSVLTLVNMAPVPSLMYVLVILVMEEQTVRNVLRLRDVYMAPAPAQVNASAMPAGLDHCAMSQSVQRDVKVSAVNLENADVMLDGRVKTVMFVYPIQAVQMGAVGGPGSVIVRKAGPGGCVIVPAGAQGGGGACAPP